MNFKQFWQVFVLSFYSSSLYIAVANKWKHWGLRFLFQLSIISSVIYTIIIFMLIFFINPEKGKLAEFLKQIPEIDISIKNTAFIDENLNSPQKIKFKEKDFIIIDLTVDSPSDSQVVLFFFSKNKVILNFNGFIEEIPYQEIAKISNQTILTYKSWIMLINSIKSQILPRIIILGITFGTVILFFISACFSMFYASIAKVILSFTKSNLDLKTLFRLANIAQAPAGALSMMAFGFFFLTEEFGMLQKIVNYSYIFYFTRAIMLNHNMVYKRKG